VMSDVLAAFLFGQLEARQVIQDRRARIWHRYAEALPDWAVQVDARLPVIPEHCGQSYHMFYVIMPSLEVRQAFIAHLRERDILAVFHYLPLDRSPFAARWPRAMACPVTAEVSDQLVRLPFYNSMTTEVQECVIEAVLAFKG